jgi:hypothetical protein
MKYLLTILLLVGCSSAPKPALGTATKPTKEVNCLKQAKLLCQDIGEEDESERDFCQNGAYEECMKKP